METQPLSPETKRKTGLATFLYQLMISARDLLPFMGGEGSRNSIPTASGNAKALGGTRKADREKGRRPLVIKRKWKPMIYAITDTTPNRFTYERFRDPKRRPNIKRLVNGHFEYLPQYK